MSLEVIYSDRRSNWSPVDITGAVRLGSLSLTSSAQLGEIASCEIELDDPNGDLGNDDDQILGMKKLDVYETDAPADNQHIFAGFIHARTYEIGLSLVTGDAVRIQAELADANDVNRYVVIRGSDGNRPAETVGARLTWLLGSSYCFVTDNGRVDYPTTAMDANDYGNQTVANVLDDCAKAVGYNYFTYIDDTALAPFSLAFFDSNTSTSYSSSLRISSVLSDVDSNVDDGPGATETWAPMFARLRRSDRTVASGVIVPYASETVYQSDSGTADTYGRIEIIAADSNLKTAAAANARAARLLWEGSTEEDLITTAIMLPRANVNDVREGERLEARFRELPGYKSGFTWFRVLKRTVKQEELTDAFYTVEYDLSPQEEPRPTCADCTPSVTNYPYSGATDFFNPVPDESDTYGPGFMYMCRSGLVFPIVPTPGYIGRWWFKTFGAGGPGTVDYGAAGVGNNTLRAVVVGNGTLTVDTVNRGGGSGTFHLVVNRQSTPGTPLNEADWFTETSDTTETTGDTVTVVVDDADGENCITLVDLSNWLGCDFGWASAEWESDCP